MITRVFVDTEFTQFSDPMLISIGAVVDESCYFYGIVTDFPERVCTQFVRDHVLPVLDAHPANVRGPHDRVAIAFVEWLQQFAETGDTLEIVADDECDIELVRRLISRSWRSEHQLLTRLQLRNRADVGLAVQQAIHTYFYADGERRHNALNDAFSYWGANFSIDTIVKDEHSDDDLSHQ